jgi:STE24 endopeptidase
VAGSVANCPTSRSPPGRLPREGARGVTRGAGSRPLQVRSAAGAGGDDTHVNEDRAARYHRLRRRVAFASALLGAAGLVALVVTPASSVLAGWAVRQSGGLAWPLRPALAVALVSGALGLGWEVLSFPLVFYRGFLLDRKYGLSSEPVRMWLADHLKALGLGLTLTLGAALAVYGAIHLAPDRWWFIVAALFFAVAVAISGIAPVWLLPLFYRFQPLESEARRERLLTLSKRAGVPALGVFEWGLGEKTSRANAALVGAGATRRILVSDTLLEGYSADEIEVILAHEMAHHVHHDLWTALVLEALIVSTSLHGSHLVATYLSPTLGLGGPSDLASLPLLVLGAGAVSVLLAPLSNAWSRFNERRADRFALRLTGRPAAFVSAMKRLGAQNLAEERPSRLVYWFFHTHPTMEQRIASAHTFKPA